VKHRHKLSQRQRQRAISQNRRSEVQEPLDEQPQPGRAKVKHSMHADGGKTKPRLDKFRRGGRRTRRLDDGGVAGGTGSTRPNDPGNELAEASKGRKGTLGRIQDELLGPKSAYARGGRQKQRRFDDGGLVDDDDIASNVAGGSSLGSNPGIFGSSLGGALSTLAKVQGSVPPPVPVPSSPAPQPTIPVSSISCMGHRRS
jgi:hypothetical protein